MIRDCVSMAIVTMTLEVMDHNLAARKLKGGEWAAQPVIPQLRNDTHLV